MSKSLYDFMVLYGQGGIVASREYHSPSRDIGADIVLWVQDFDEIRIRKMIYKYLPNAGRVVWEKLKEDTEMLFLCRNPFHLTLLVNFVMNSGKELPENQMELYSGFFSFNQARSDKKEVVKERRVRDKAIELALYLQNQRRYECPISSLPGDVNEWNKALYVLVKKRVCRIGDVGGDHIITFTHRRFQEYFLVLNMINCGTRFSKEVQKSIINYSDLRDSYVLYCEIADENIVSEIASFCWKIIQDNFDIGEEHWEKEKLVNTLFFVSDAFRRRPGVLLRSSKDFEKKIMSWINQTKDFMVRLALINCMVLFNQNDLQKYVVYIFEIGNSWYDDAVMTNCHKIKMLEPQVESSFYYFFRKMDYVTFFRRFRNIHFSLSISKQFRSLNRRHVVLLAKYVCQALFVCAILLYGIIIWAMPSSVYMYAKEGSSHITDDFWIRMIALFIINFGRYASEEFLDNWKYYVLSMITLTESLTLGLVAAMILKDLHFQFERKLSSLFKNPHISFLSIDFIYIILACVVANYVVPYITWDMYSISCLLLFITVGIEIFDACKDNKLSKIPFRSIIEVGRYLFYALLAFGTAIINRYFLSDRMAHFFSVVMYIVMCGAIIIVLYIAIKYYINAIYDAKLLREIRDLLNMDFTPQINRSDVSKNLMSFKTNKGKQRYLELLIEKETVLIGAWPKDFSADDVSTDDSTIILHSLAVLDWSGKPVGKRIS